MEHLAERMYKPYGVPHSTEGEEVAGPLLFPATRLKRYTLMRNPVAVLDEISVRLNRILLWIGAVALIMMVVLTCGNIFLRIVWTPIKGTFELMGFFSAIVTAFALGYTQMKKGHTGIDVVVNLFSKGTRRILNGINNLILTAFFSILGWQLMKWGVTLCKAGEVSETLRMVFYPFVYCVGFGCFGLALVLLVDMFKVFMQGKEV